MDLDAVNEDFGVKAEIKDEDEVDSDFVNEEFGVKVEVKDEDASNDDCVQIKPPKPPDSSFENRVRLWRKKCLDFQPCNSKGAILFGIVMASVYQCASSYVFPGFVAPIFSLLLG